MSEELLQTVPQKIGKYTYLRLGNTTLNQLQSAGIIPARDYGDLGTKRPDGLVLYQSRVRAVVEYKQPKELRTETDVQAAISQEGEVAKALCKTLIVTDSTKSYWVNALNGDFIRDNGGETIQTVFHPFAVKDISTLEYLLDTIEGSITDLNSMLHSDQLIDPTPIATRLWQTIWVATGKSPMKCLYNVVELFIFKFLSDLRILPDHISFNDVYAKSLIDPEEALEYYAVNSRRRIQQLFPAANDGTTIINGTIFVDETGEPNLSQSILFARCLQHLQLYSEEFGSLTKIDKQFKTKLYETFLKQEVEALGQYFTPRRVVQSVIRMAGANEASFQFSGKRICDPFCGVGGFLVELLNMNDGMFRGYIPDADGTIELPFEMHGFDKGFEREEERVIILAKANLLIYLAEVLFNNPSCTHEFARVFKDTFRLFKDNLGTFGHIIKDEDDKYDLILSNPPYVTSGSSIIKEEIQRNPTTANEYPVSGLGLESLSIEWVVKSLKPGGMAFLIVPDGILARTSTSGRALRDHILQECFLDAIVSLPRRTFFANEKDTYILAITKKNNPADLQTAGVFAYLVSNIGERLTSVRRDEIDLGDLPEMEALFRLYRGTDDTGSSIIADQSHRCKVLPIAWFKQSRHWVINKRWSDQELTLLNADARRPVSREEFSSILAALELASSEYEETLVSTNVDAIPTREVSLGDPSLFRTFIGKRLIKRNVQDPSNPIPAYSANVFKPFGWVMRSNVEDFTCPSLLWGIDGDFDVQYIPAGEIFATTDHCGTIQILDPTINPEYLLYAVNAAGEMTRFTRSFRSSLTSMRELTVKIPVKADGQFDEETQQEIATAFTVARSKERALLEMKLELDDAFGRYITLGNNAI